VYDEKGAPAAIEGFMSDITARQRADAERVRLLREAQEAVAAREGFLAMATHDLRSPLTALKLHVQSSLRRLDKGEDWSEADVSRILRRIDHQVDRMQHFVEDLLDVSRASAGRLEVRLKDV